MGISLVELAQDSQLPQISGKDVFLRQVARLELGLLNMPQPSELSTSVRQAVSRLETERAAYE